MANAITKLPSKIAESYKKLTKGQKVRLFVLIAIILAIIIVVSIFLNQKNYVVVFAGSAADAGEVMTALDDMGVSYKTQGTGTILVEESAASGVKMELAAKGYPSGGYSNDIFQSASGLGVTDMEKKKYWVLQQQENIRRNLKTLNKVDDALVNLDIPDESAFALSDDEKKPSASVTLVLKDGQSLTESEVQTVCDIVTGAVSGMEPEDVRIVDSQMRNYSTGSDSTSANVDTQLGLQDAVAQNLQSQVINLLTPVFGADNIRATVNVTLNFDDKTTETVEFAPPAGGTEGLAVSMSDLVEAIKNNGSGSVAGIDANGTASEYLNSLQDDADNSVYYQASHDVNYELNKTNKTIVEAKGKIEKLSVAVLINEDSADDYTDEVTELVATALGVDKEHITVSMLPFAKVDETAVQDALADQQDALNRIQSAETTRMLIILATVLVVMIFLFMIFKMFKKKPEPALAEGGFEYIADEEIIPGEPEQVIQSFDDIKLEDFEKTDNKLAILEDYIGKNPESVANLLRNWLNED